jgi:hypothetical protein
MNDERKYEEILEKFVDAMNNGTDFSLDDLLEVEDAEPEIMSLLDFAAWFKVSSSETIAEEAAQVKSAIRIANSAAWSMQKLIASGSTNTLQAASQSGLTRQQLEELSEDPTPFSVDNPNDYVRQLAGKYQVRFLNLLGWVRSLITDAMSSETTANNWSPVYTREEKSNGPDDEDLSEGKDA